VLDVLVVGLDSYASLEDLNAIAGDYGHAALIEATDDIALEGFARQAVMYLDAAYSWLGKRSVAGQPLAWPRTGIISDLDGVPIPPDAIPAEIVTAQALLMVAAGAGDLAGGTGGPGADREIIRETADDASVEYERGSSARRFPMISGLVAHLCTAHQIGPFRQIQAARG
jgi:hypothetical protein